MRVREPIGGGLSSPEPPLSFVPLRSLPSLRGGRGGARWGDAARRAVGGYALLAVIATTLAFVLRDGVPWTHPEPWLVAPTPVSLASSTMLGLTAALGIIASTRLAVRRFGWARRLHAELRPVARELSDGQILAVAALSAVGEEVFFRGLLVPVIGVVLAAVAFGFVHQLKMRGPSRWVWTAWAAAVGLVLGSVFALTGSLVGPLLAHAVVNAANMLYVRDNDVARG